MIKIKKLNASGFGHHFLLPILVIALIAAAGSYIVMRSKAAVPAGRIYFSDGATIKSMRPDGSDIKTFTNPDILSGYGTNIGDISKDRNYATSGGWTAKADGQRFSLFTTTDCVDGGETIPGADSFNQFKPSASTAGSLPVVTYTVRKNTCAGKFISQDIYTANIDGTNKKRLTNNTNDSKDSIVGWSSDGKSLVFTTENYATGRYTLKIRRGNGEIVNLGRIGDVSLSGDGRTVVFSSSPTFNLYKVSSDGTNKQKLNTAGQCGIFGLRSLNQDGTKLLCNSGTNSVGLLNLSNSRFKIIDTVRNGRSITLTDQAASWAPNNTWVVYNVFDSNDRNTTIRVTKQDGSAKKDIYKSNLFQEIIWR